MKRPDEDTLRALVALQGNPNWERVLFWIRETYNQAMANLGENTTFNAGRAAEIHDFLKNVHESRINLETLLKAKKQ